MPQSAVSIGLFSLKKSILLFFLGHCCLFVQSQEFAHRTFDVFFEKGIDQLDAEAMALIRKHMVDVGSSNIREVFLTGHADTDADSLYNQHLSERRTMNAKQFMLGQGVPERLISSHSLGETMQVFQGKDKNRRVEITLYYAVDPKRQGNLVLIGKVFHAHTGKPLGADYSMERDGQNIFGKTNRKGEFSLRLKSGNDFRLMVSREGFLSEVQSLSQQSIARISGDTLFMNFRLSPVQVVEKVRFNHIYFYTDRDVLKPESKEDLQKLVLMLRQQEDLYIQIQGHVNFPISRKITPALELYNHDLSYRRARTVYRYLLEQGIEPSRLTYIGLGNSQMIHPDPKDEKEADMNKRVEIWKLRKL